MPARTLSLDDKLALLPKIFDQAQNTTANHSKNFAALYKVHSEAAKVTESVHGGEGIKLTGERAFEDAVIDVVNRVLTVKKGEAVADRIVKFVGGYVRFAEEKAEDGKKGEEDDEDEGSPPARFSIRLMRHLLKGFLAKDKNVRYRCVQCLAEVITHMEEIDDDLYEILRSHLMERVRDKEAIIRVQAVVALSKLAGSENPDDLEDDEVGTVETLIDILRYDPSPEVRRAALLSTPPSPRTVKHLLTRTRDPDTLVRKLLYGSVLLDSLHHPQQLSIAQREKIVRDGLGDRDPAVRTAASKLIASWVDTLEGSLEDFLKVFDLISEEESGHIAEDALKSVFTTRPDFLDGCDFNEAYWADLTPPKAFLARVFVDFCISSNSLDKHEGALPVVTFLAFKIQSTYNALLERVQELSIERGGDNEEGDEKQEEMEFVIGEMLRLAVNLDYADEIGRRKMFGLVREMISQEAMPPSLVNKCLDVMRNLSSGERDLIRVIVEVIQELRDPGEAEKEFELNEGDGNTTQGSDTPRTARARSMVPFAEREKEMTDEERKHANIVDLRCLVLCHGMLERVNGVRAAKTFEENSTLEGVLADLIVPAVKRKEYALREKGLICLGLCCLIAKRMALNSFQLFLSQVQTAPEPLKLPVLQVVFDILMVHGRDFLHAESAAIPVERLVDFLLFLIQNEESAAIQGVLIVGICKLMLSGLITDEKILKSLVLTFFSPDMADNQEVRQCLSYFFPAYCYSSSANQRQVQKISVPILQLLYDLHREVQEDGTMVAPPQMALLLVDWTDPQKAIEVRGQQIDETVHLDLAMDILEALLGQPLAVELQKILVGLLGKLYLPSEADNERVFKLKLLLDCLKMRRPRRDTSSKNAVTKFDKAFAKKYATQLESFDEATLREQEAEVFADVIEVIDNMPDTNEEGEEIELPPVIKKRSAPRQRATSISTLATNDSDDDEGGTPKPKRTQPARTPKTNRKKVVEDDEDGEDSDDELNETPQRQPRKQPPTSSRRKPAPRGRKATSPPESRTGSSVVDEDEDDKDVDEDSDDELNEDVHETPQRRPQKAASRRKAAPARGRKVTSPPESGAESHSVVDEDEDEVDDLI